MLGKNTLITGCHPKDVGHYIRHTGKRYSDGYDHPGIGERLLERDVDHRPDGVNHSSESMEKETSSRCNGSNSAEDP